MNSSPRGRGWIDGAVAVSRPHRRQTAGGRSDLLVRTQRRRGRLLDDASVLEQTRAGSTFSTDLDAFHGASRPGRPTWRPAEFLDGGGNAYPGRWAALINEETQPFGGEQVGRYEEAVQAIVVRRTRLTAPKRPSAAARSARRHDPRTMVRPERCARTGPRKSRRRRRRRLHPDSRRYRSSRTHSSTATITAMIMAGDRRRSPSAGYQGAVGISSLSATESRRPLGRNAARGSDRRIQLQAQGPR